jgi:hypothetical protein
MNQAVFSATVFKLGSDPIKATGNPATIIGVFIDMKRFKYERPLIRAEMNGLSWLSHEWIRCVCESVRVGF